MVLLLLLLWLLWLVARPWWRGCGCGWWWCVEELSGAETGWAWAMHLSKSGHAYVWDSRLLSKIVLHIYISNRFKKR